MTCSAQAIRRVRGARPGSVETRDQEAASELFEKHLGEQKERDREREREVYFFHLESGDFLELTFYNHFYKVWLGILLLFTEM